MADKTTTDKAATDKDAPATTLAPTVECIEGDGGVVYGDSPIITEPIREAGDPPSLISPPSAGPPDFSDIPELPADAPASQSSQSQSSPPEESYESNTVAELKTELQARGLPTFGTKDELVGRLEADDADPATPPGNTTA